MSSPCRPARSSTVSSTRCAYSAASFGTSRVRMLRSMPPCCSNISALALRRLDQRGAVLPFDAARARRAARARARAAPAPSPNRHALISTPGSSSRYIAALLTSTQIESTCSAAPEAIERAAELQVRQRRRATLADQVVGLHVGAEAEALDDVARKARTEVAGAGADDDARRCRRASVRHARAHASRPSAASAGACARKRRPSVSGSIVKTSSSESSARRRASMPLSRCRTVRAMKCERASSRPNQSERLERREAFGLGVAGGRGGRADSDEMHAPIRLGRGQWSLSIAAMCEPCRDACDSRARRGPGGAIRAWPLRRSSRRPPGGRGHPGLCERRRGALRRAGPMRGGRMAERPDVGSPQDASGDDGRTEHDDGAGRGVDAHRVAERRARRGEQRVAEPARACPATATAPPRVASAMPTASGPRPAGIEADSELR